VIASVDFGLEVEFEVEVGRGFGPCDLLAGRLAAVIMATPVR
jgi:hypothetical protein